MPEPLVVDASFLASFFIPDEDRSHLDRLLNQIEDYDLHAPDFYLIELGNVLSVSLQRGRITPDDLQESLAQAEALPILPHSNVNRLSLPRQIALARRTGLSFYDALYLDLTLLHSARLATLDGRLRTAAAAEGVTLYL